MRSAIPCLVGLATVLAGCEDICESDHLPTCDIREASCQQLVQEEVRCMRGATSSELPPVMLLTIPEYEERLRAGADPEMMRMLSWEGALELLRLLEPGGDLFEVSIAASLANTAAFYSTSERAVYVIDRGMPADSVDSVATLAHELVHAAQDEEHDLHARLDAARTHEEVMLLRSVVEGEAMFYTYEAYLWDLGAGPDEVLWPSLHREALEIFRSNLDAAPSPYIVVNGLMPYVIGSRWATGRWLRGDDELVRAGVPMPPESSAWLMVDPFTAGSTPPPESTVECDAPPAPAGFEPLAPDVMGAPIVYAFLRRWGMSHAEAWELALEWRGDDLYVYGAPDGRVALAWRIVFERTATPRWVATQLEAMLAPFRAGYVEDTAMLLASEDPALLAEWTWSATQPVCAPPPTP